MNCDKEANEKAASPRLTHSKKPPIDTCKLRAVLIFTAHTF